MITAEKVPQGIQVDWFKLAGKVKTVVAFLLAAYYASGILAVSFLATRILQLPPGLMELAHHGAVDPDTPQTFLTIDVLIRLGFLYGGLGFLALSKISHFKRSDFFLKRSARPKLTLVCIAFLNALLVMKFAAFCFGTDRFDIYHILFSQMDLSSIDMALVSEFSISLLFPVVYAPAFYLIFRTLKISVVRSYFWSVFSLVFLQIVLGLFVFNFGGKLDIAVGWIAVSVPSLILCLSPYRARQIAMVSIMFIGLAVLISPLDQFVGNFTPAPSVSSASQASSN